MKQYVSKEDALQMIPSLKWQKVGTLMRKPKKVPPEKVLALLTDPEVGEDVGEWRMYYTGDGRYVVCNSKDHDKYYEAIKDDEGKSDTLS